MFQQASIPVTSSCRVRVSGVKRKVGYEEEFGTESSQKRRRELSPEDMSPKPQSREPTPPPQSSPPGSPMDVATDHGERA